MMRGENQGLTMMAATFTTMCRRCGGCFENVNKIIPQKSPRMIAFRGINITTATNPSLPRIAEAIPLTQFACGEKVTMNDIARLALDHSIQYSIPQLPSIFIVWTVTHQWQCSLKYDSKYLIQFTFIDYLIT